MPTPPSAPERLTPDSGSPGDSFASRRIVPRPLATIILASFVITFLLARLFVLLIMTHRIRSLYLHVGGTHVHHLNYGIFILSAVGAFYS